MMGMGGGKNPAERLKETLCEKGFDAFVYESPLDQVAWNNRSRQETSQASICILQEAVVTRIFSVKDMDLVIRLLRSERKTELRTFQGRRKNFVVCI